MTINNNFSQFLPTKGCALVGQSQIQSNETRDSQQVEISTLLRCATIFRQMSTIMSRDSCATPQMNFSPKIGLDDRTDALLARAVDVFKETQNTMNDFMTEGSVPDRLANSMETITSIMLKLKDLDVDDTLKQTINGFQDTLVEAVKESDVIKNAKNLSLVIIAASCGVAWFYNPTTLNKFLAVASSLALILFSNVITQESLFSYFTSLFSEEAKPQFGNEEIDSLSTAAVTLFSGYLTTTSGKSMPRECMDHLRNFSRVKGSIKDIISCFVQTIEKIYNYFNTNFCGNDSVRFLSTNIHDVDVYLDDVNSLLDKDRNGKLFRGLDNSNSIAAMIASGHKIYAVCLQQVPLQEFILLYNNLSLPLKN